MSALNLVVVTGLSGSGKTTVAKAFEDLGYFCVDNLPSPLLDAFVDLVGKTEPAIEDAVVVMDVRAGALLAQAPGVLRSVGGKTARTRVLFLE